MKPDVERQAAEWLARLDASDLAEVREQLSAWRAADPANEAAWLRVSSAWERLDRLASLRPPADMPADPDLLASQPASGTRAWSIAAAASVLVAAFGIALYLQPTGSDAMVATQVGERRVVKLEDNSSVSLNTASALKVRYREAERRIEMQEGEAVFTVEKDAARPFVVVARGLEVRAVGTAFAVRVKSEGVEIAVTEGIVAVASGGASKENVRLVAGQVALYSGAQGLVRNAPAAELERKLAWQGGMIAFEGEPLSEAIEEFNRYNRHKIVIADPAIAALRVGGYFRSDDVPGFVAALRSSFELTSTPGESVTYLSASR